MASDFEAMDVDEVAGDSEDKENIFNNNGLEVSPRAPADLVCEDLDVSEMNMKLRLSCTPLVSPAPRKHFAGSAKKLFSESGDNDLYNQTVTIDSADVTMTEWSMGDHNENNSNIHSTTITDKSKMGDARETMALTHDFTTQIESIDNNNTTINGNNTYTCDNTINGPGLSAPVSTPSKDAPNPSTSPIMRGLKSVLSIFRPSQSPIFQTDDLSDMESRQQDLVSPTSSANSEVKSTETVLVSTPVLASNNNSKNLDSVSDINNSQIKTVFNEDLMSDLQWNDDSTIIFNKNKFPGHRLCTPSDSLQSQSRKSITSLENSGHSELNNKNDESEERTDKTTNHMEISMNNSNVECVMSPMCGDIPETKTEGTIDREFIKIVAENILVSVFEKAKTTIDNLSSVIINNNETPESTDKLILHLQKTNKGVNFDEELFTVNGDDKEFQVNRSEISIQIDSKSSEVDRTIMSTEQTLLPKLIDKTCGNYQLLEEPVEKSNENTKVSIQTDILKDNNKNKDHEKNISICNKSNENSEVMLPFKDNLNSEKPQEVINNECNEKSLNNTQITVSNNNSPNILLVTPAENNLDMLHAKNIAESDFTIVDNIEHVELIMSGSSVASSPRPNINFNEIDNPFESRPRVSSSPIRTTLCEIFDSNKVLQSEKHSDSHNVNFSSDSSEINEDMEVKNLIQNNDINSEHILAKNQENNMNNTRCENYDSIEISQESANLTLALESIVNCAHVSDIQNTDTHEQSDAYLSADSGRESEQLLDSEAEVTDNLVHTSSSNDEVIGNTNNVINTIGECIDNAFSTKTNMCLSPPPQQYNSKLLEESSSGIDNPFTTKSKLRLSPIPQNFYSNTENPLTTLPTLLHENYGSVKEKVAAKEIVIDSIQCNYSGVTEIDSTEKYNIEKLSDRIQPIIDSNCTVKYDSLNKTVEDFENTFIIENKIGTPYSESSLSVTAGKQTAQKEEFYHEITSTNLQMQPDTTVLLTTSNKDDTDSIATPNKRIYELDCLSGSSSSSSERDVTIREIKTEDEDTLEGPNFAGLEEISENLFENKSSSPDIEEQSDKNEGIPKVIMCSDLTSEKCTGEDLTSEEEFMECVEEEFKPGELFINADTFDFLMNQNSSSRQDCGKESLFLKFDPLCAAKRKSGVLAMSEVNLKDTDNSKSDANETIAKENSQTCQSVTTPDKLDKTYTQKSTDTPENTSMKDLSAFNFDKTYTQTNYPENEVSWCGSILPEKPMMAVIPAVNNEPILNARSSPYTPTRPERRSATFSSPAIAAIDRLISLSGNNSPTSQAYYIDDTTRQETREAVIQLQEMLVVKEAEVEHLRKDCNDLQNRLTDLQIQMKSLMEDNVERQKKIVDLKGRLEHKRFINNNLDMVIHEYERSIAAMVTENDQLKQKHQLERAELIKERDEQIEHLNSMEVSFNDLHTKYERAKQLILTFKANEEALRKTIDEFKENQQKMETNYDILKQQAISKLNFANTEFEKLRRGHEAEVIKLTAQIKRKELHISSLEETVAQKTKENQDLTAICDELISKVS